MGLLGSLGGIAGSIFGGPVGGAVGGLIGGALDGKPKSGVAGQGGANSPAYVPVGQSAADQNFLYNKNLYEGTNQNIYNTVNPYNNQLLNSQFNNPFNTAATDIAAWGQNQYLNNAQQLQGNQPKAWDYANQQYQNANQQNALYQQGLGNVQKSVSGLYGQADKSNQTYNDLIKYQQGQLPRIQQSQGNLYGSGDTVLNTAFDPQNALYNRTQQQLTDQSRAGQYARGIQQTPYGAALENSANQNFNIDWQNQQLARQSQGLQAAQGAYGSAQGLGNSYTQNVGGLQNAQNQGYSDLTNAAQNQYTNYLSNINQNNLAQTQNIGASTQNAANVGNQAGQALQGAFNAGYGGQQQVLQNQQQALQNYQNTQQPYLSNIYNQNNQNLAYLGYGNQSQNLQYNQNMQNQQQNQQAIGSVAGPILNWAGTKGNDWFQNSDIGNSLWNWSGGLGGTL